ncbi:MAG: ActS/PrrB/RegB family redox-sensitive histidine kinase [Alphaproteobacteria bacterium]
MTADTVLAHSDYARLLHAGLRIRTLALIRWIAVAGQLTTILMVQFVFGYRLPLVAALGAVAALALLNVWSINSRRGRTRFSDVEATLSLAFDVLQLSLLLFLTGGLENPFSVMVLAPVTIAATILPPRGTLAVGLLAALCVTSLLLWHLPLPWKGAPFAIPPTFTIGLWVALVLSTGLLAAYNWSLAEEARRLAEALNETQLALAYEQNVSSLGMLAASTAHRLGSPLGTIAVIAKEIANELPPDSPHRDDAALLMSETKRCRQILAELAERPEQSDGPLFARLPFTALVEAAASAHRDSRIRTEMPSGPAEGYGNVAMPMVPNSPEIIHGLGSLIQNAIQFARSRVTVSVMWTPEEVTVEVLDDGPGFSPYILSQIGEPYVSSRKSVNGHMGLGVFIAQTLLQRTGAVLSFGNQVQQGGGAVATVRWSRQVLEHVGV